MFNDAVTPQLGLRNCGGDSQERALILSNIALEAADLVLEGIRYAQCDLSSTLRSVATGRQQRSGVQAASSAAAAEAHVG